MKVAIYLGALLLFLTLCSGAALAQNSSTTPAPETALVPLSDPAYSKISELVSDGIPITVPQHVKFGQPQMTRDEFAASIVSVLPVINAAPENENDLSPDQAQAVSSLYELYEGSEAANDLASLVDEFAPDLHRIGQDPEAIRARLDSIAQQDAVVPPNDPAYRYVDILQKAGIVIGYPDGTYGGRRVMTRFDFAVAIASLLPLINSTATSNSELSALQREMKSRLEGNEKALGALWALVFEFAPELKQLGQDSSAIEAGLDSLIAAVPFQGVPKEHWAYQAVETLKKAGIVVGYPDGTY